jgi:hypothetical protein
MKGKARRVRGRNAAVGNQTALDGLEEHFSRSGPSQDAIIFLREAPVGHPNREMSD